MIKTTVIKTANTKFIFTARSSNLPLFCAPPFHFPSSFRVSICNRQRHYGTCSPFQLFENNEEITSEVINETLANKQVSITQEELDKLKSIPGVKFYLPLNYETARTFVDLIGKQRSQKSGVYVFTHLESGSKYVGSSNNLSYRISNYFRHEDNQRYDSGLMLPILREKGIRAFSLEIAFVYLYSS